MFEKRITSQIRQCIRRDRIAGVSPPVIAKRYGFDLTTIYKLSKDITKKQKNERQEELKKRNDLIVNRVTRGKSVAEVAAEFFLSEHSIRGIVRSYYPETGFKLLRGSKRYSPTQKLSLATAVNIAAAKGKMTVKEAMATFDATESMVRDIWSKRRWKSAWAILDEAEEAERSLHDNRAGGRGKPRFNIKKKDGNDGTQRSTAQRAEK